MATRVIWLGDQVAQKVRRATKTGIDEVMALCVATSKERVSKKTTTLQGGIQMRGAIDFGGKIVGFWGVFDVLYGIFVELGTRPHMPPVEAIALSMKISMAAAWPIALSIARKGTKPHPYLVPSANMHYPKLIGFIRRRIK